MAAREKVFFRPVSSFELTPNFIRGHQVMISQVNHTGDILRKGPNIDDFALDL